jgi:hypothetical protein
MMRKALPLVAFGVVLLAAGVLHGLHTDRWRTTADLDDAVRRLDAVPQDLGDWHGEKQVFDADDLRRAGIRGHSGYRYRNAATGERISLLIVCGRFGPISVHTPDICYGAAGYTAIGDRVQKKISVGSDRTQSVWALQFKAPPTSSAAPIEVNWVWNGGKGWVAPENSRWAFSGYPVLYKLYVVRELPVKAATQQSDPSASFLQTFLPELEKVLAR